MDIFILIVVCLFLFAVLKTRVFSTEEEKCFRRIWSMNKINSFTEKEATYQRLFLRFGVSFSEEVNNKDLISLIGAAHNFDATKNQNNLGVRVGPIVEREVGRRMEQAGKGEQFDELQTNMTIAGNNFINEVIKNMNK